MREVSKNIPIRVHGESGRNILVEGKQLQSGRCRLVARFDGNGCYAEDHDFFQSLRTIRKCLEKLGIELLCQGSRRDVWPSAMSSQMGAGLRAYVCVMRQPATELVPIFEPAPEIEYSNVIEQSKYHHEWFESLGT